MSDGAIEVRAEGFERALGEVAKLAKKKTQGELLREYAAMGVKQFVYRTPPFLADKGTADSPIKARRRGEAKIDRDISLVFQPVRLKGVRPEVTPDPEPIWLERKRKKFERKKQRMTRGRAQAYYVAREKVKALAKKAKLSIGKLASGWNRAWASLRKDSPPAFVKRHGQSLGQVRLSVQFDPYTITITNAAPYVGKIDDMRRRIDMAFVFIVNGMRARMDKAARAIEEKASRSGG